MCVCVNSPGNVFLRLHNVCGCEGSVWYFVFLAGVNELPALPSTETLSAAHQIPAAQSWNLDSDNDKK